jgi:hypothetical protein
MHRIGRILRTIGLVCSSLKPGPNRNGSPFWTAVATPIKPESSITGTGEFGFFFPNTTSFAAPFLLFHLKRRGYSDCRIISKADGLYLFARR